MASWPHTGSEFASISPTGSLSSRLSYPLAQGTSPSGVLRAQNPVCPNQSPDFCLLPQSCFSSPFPTSVNDISNFFLLRSFIFLSHVTSRMSSKCICSTVTIWAESNHSSYGHARVSWLDYQESGHVLGWMQVKMDVKIRLFWHLLCKMPQISIIIR